MERLVLTVPSHLFSPAETAVFSGSYEPELFSCGPDEYRTVGALPYCVTLTNVGGAILVSGSVTGRLVTSCSRCLADMEVELNGEVEGYFIIEGEGEAPDDMDEDEFDVLPESHEIDLESLLMAAILVDMPLMPLCKDDCKGICSQCGSDLNEGPCGCVSDEVQLGKNNPFAALKDLTFE
ncbi:MAG: DUF177 domain-containing protein [Slackia sp.]|nr:DUF177 domain-containing protein [Slackia sp.]